MDRFIELLTIMSIIGFWAVLLTFGLHRFAQKVKLSTKNYKLLFGSLTLCLLIGTSILNATSTNPTPMLWATIPLFLVVVVVQWLTRRS